MSDYLTRYYGKKKLHSETCGQVYSLVRTPERLVEEHQRDRWTPIKQLTPDLVRDIILLRLPPSSSGPGRGPLKAKTRIRIPVGAFFI